MMRLEQIRMYNAGNGISVVILKQKIGGTVCKACVDVDTRQHQGSTLCDKCYGTGIEGGFDEPVITFVEMQGQQKTIKYDNQGRGSDDDTQVQIRVVAYPEMRRGDIIVNPRTDHRYIVNGFDTYEFKGIVPFVYHLKCELLTREDIKYKVEVPQIPV
jgi:hypothetical protein